MVIMTAIVIGVLIISIIVYLEGSMKVTVMSFLSLIPLSLILGLNMYVISMDDLEEVVFFNRNDGFKYVNLSLLASVTIFLYSFSHAYFGVDDQMEQD